MQKNGDTLSGGLTFENDSILAWIRNTDWAKIGLKIMPTATLIHTCGLKQATTAMNISNGEAARAPQQKT